MITLKTLHTATAQQVFDQVAIHLLTQNEKSTTITGDCAYRGKDGFKCAAGCLISDEEYEKRFENKTWERLVDMNQIPADHSELIQELQEIHDSVCVYNWETRLRTLAESFNLTFPAR